MREPQDVLSMVQRVKVLSRNAVLAEVGGSLEALVRRYLSLEGITEADEDELDEILQGPMKTFDLIERGEIREEEKLDRIHQSIRQCRELIEAKFPPLIRDTFPAPQEADK